MGKTGVSEREREREREKKHLLSRMGHPSAARRRHPLCLPNPPPPQVQRTMLEIVNQLDGFEVTPLLPPPPTPS